MSGNTVFWYSDSSSDDELDLSKRMIFGNRFHLIERLGSGGFGQVWRVRDSFLDQEVALKISSKDLTKETILLRRLPKDRYVSVYDYVKDDVCNATAYSMEVLEKPWMTLTRYYELSLSRDFSNGQFLRAVIQVLCVSIDLLTSLEHLHGKKHGRSNRWCHADIKPENLYVDSKKLACITIENYDTKLLQIVKIGDLGLAKESGSSLNGGTSGFRSPEQNGSGVVSPLTDVFSVGQTISAMIFGTPFNDSDLVHINRIKERLSLTIPCAYLVENLSDSLRGMTMKHPNQRPNTEVARNKLKKLLENDTDWLILDIFAFSSLGLTLEQAALQLFTKLAPSRRWKNLMPERNAEMKDLIRAAYRRRLLSRIGHTYQVRLP